MAKTLKEKSEKDLTKDLKEKREELRELRLGKKALPHSRYEREVRKDVARVMTELNSRT